MHRSLTLLRINEDQGNLQDRTRIFRLFVSTYSLTFVGACFLLTIAAGLSIAIKEVCTMGGLPIDWGTVIFLALFFFPALIAGAAMLYWIFRRPLWRYLRNPSQFQFIQGKAINATYRAGSKGRRAGSKMIVEFHADGVGTFTENFLPYIWMYSDNHRERSLKEGDDWFDLKGKRPKMPFPVHLLQHISETKLVGLVGIPAHAVDPAIALIEVRSKADSRSVKLGAILMLFALLAYFTFKSFLHSN